jgi:hypothetical protein
LSPPFPYRYSFFPIIFEIGNNVPRKGMTNENKDLKAPRFHPQQVDFRLFVGEHQIFLTGFEFIFYPVDLIDPVKI